ncbi:MAG: hypothetical protein ABI607_14615 [Betaproteobacteria bacterium]
MTTDSEINWPRQAAVDLIALPSRDVSDNRPSIKFGEWEFSAPRLMFKGPLPAKAGLFAIHVRVRSWFSRQYEPIHFGESSNLYRKLAVDSGDEFVRWLMHPQAVYGLFVSICPTAGMHKPAREFATRRLLARYLPDLTQSAEALMAELDDPLAGDWRKGKG